VPVRDPKRAHELPMGMGSLAEDEELTVRLPSLRMEKSIVAGATQGQITAVNVADGPEGNQKFRNLVAPDADVKRGATYFEGNYSAILQTETRSVLAGAFAWFR
jgi:hypothetical protein